MHNLLSRSQLDGWRDIRETANDLNRSLDDYYECLIECDSLNQNECKRVCRQILT